MAFYMLYLIYGAYYSLVTMHLECIKYNISHKYNMYKWRKVLKYVKKITI